ncbi:MAG: aspartate aminotransferase family protein [Chloroflexi bacterium]|nr:aspartate aminotransferase family protein [Chloroflexota bacterium]MCY3695665.1 aspartate aminotransferase family protein [Chloroflexota bacterium]MXX80521.1 aspartate aminotransferase family protein [Chloroflexota bacterium]MYF23464.1 aspartate aminotransferase family protein [Chloroflexota bacterium]
MTTETTQDLLERRARLLGAGIATFYDDPVHIVRGEGAWLFDADGRRYLDLYNNVPCVGHAHPRVVEAMQRQTETLNVHSRYLHEGILDYAEHLTSLHADHLTTAVFTCSGTEANEVAILMARAATGGRGLIYTQAAYHGNSTEVRKLSRLRGEHEPQFRSIPVPQRYRPIAEDLDDEALTEAYLARLRAEIDGFAEDGVPFAGMMVCSILANEGLPDIPPGFMSRAAEMVRNAGGLFICDEVQAGFARSGNWWGYETTGIRPDIVSMGKPMGNGLPLAGVVASRELVETFRDRTRYFNTFASSPLQAAVGEAVLSVIEDEGLVQSVADVGGYLIENLRSLQEGCEPMSDVRGHGLFIGMEWVSDRAARTPDPDGADVIVNRLRRAGFLMGRAGEFGNVLKVRPPLVLQREQADMFLEAFEAAIAEPV